MSTLVRSAARSGRALPLREVEAHRRRHLEAGELLFAQAAARPSHAEIVFRLI